MDRVTPIQIRVVPIIAVLVIGIFAVATVIPTGQVLVVEDPETGEHYITEPVHDETTVGLEYMHSVEKTRVYDEYSVEGDMLVNTRMEFESYGWGLPARANVTNVNGTFVYAPDEPITELRTLSVSPGRIAGHELTIGTKTYNLVTETNTSDVRIHIEQRTLIDRFV